MATMPFVSEGKCVSVEWDFLQGLLAKPPTLPCLQNLRKEKSRNAARSRRGKENFEFFELAKMLPLPGAITSQLDKASVIRLTISYLHMRHFANQGDPPWIPLMEGENHCAKVRRTINSLAMDIFELHHGAHLLQSLDGFVFVVSQEGRFLYISETVSIYLGLSQVELTGSSVFDYIHPADHVEMAERLGIKPHLRAEAGCHMTNESASSSASTPSLAGTPEPAPSSPFTPADELRDRGFFIRMKSTLTKRGLHIKSSGYKVIHVTGRIRCRPALVHGSGRSLYRPLGLVALAHTLPPSTLNEVRMEAQMFVFRVNMDLQVTYCENRITEYMDLSPAEVVGKTCYHFIHVEDLESLRQSHEDLLRKGQVVTNYYRWLQRRGGYLWVQSCATVSINHKAPHERNIIWVNYVISRTEMPDVALDLLQLPEGLRAERLERASSSPHTISPKASGAGVSLAVKGSKLEPELKHREVYSHPPASQSEDRRKRARRQSSSPDGAPPGARRRVQEFRPREESPAASSEPGSESDAEDEEDEEEEEERGNAWGGHHEGGRGKKRKSEDQGAAMKTTAGVGGNRIHNGRAVIRQLRGAAPLPSSPGGIKTERDSSSSSSSISSGGSVGAGGPGSTGGRWSTHTQPSSHTPTPGSLAEDRSPPAPATDPADAPPKSLYPPPPPSVSPPGLSPPSRDDRGVLGSHGVGGGSCGGGGGRVADFELLQRLTAAATGGGASGRVLFHPLALGPQGPQSLYAPSTIRYAPPELPPSHPPSSSAASQSLRSDHHPAKPPHHPSHHPHPHHAAAFFPHFQRIAALPPFSGFSASEAAFSAGLPFCMNGLRGATGPEED
ncbi:neuronal PAS domain-containing protein 1 [Clupea harengus]|uniref:Neuronal PAS domain-containing protein 1 n=1 Tax=Clupea harengus TaxID=7950 RepID=A0A6P8G259_CLUHA|nr:neuronal PAS domain-containing protein 1 [Clupea harengus]